MLFRKSFGSHRAEEIRESTVMSGRINPFGLLAHINSIPNKK
jgi:hypothetical protein